MHQNFSEYKQMFFNDGYQLGLDAVKDGYHEHTLFQAIEQMHQAIDQLIDSLAGMAQKQGLPVNCKKGCAWCCHQAVFANSYELKHLGHFIQKHFSAEQTQQVKKQSSAKNEITSALKQEQVLSYKSPCPLLKDGACTAYQARPMACRIYLSTRVASCLEFYKNPTDKDHYPALLDFPLRAGQMMNEGFMAALAEVGIETTEFRLEDGLNSFLSF